MIYFNKQGEQVVQLLLQQQQLPCCVLPASFKNPRQVLEVLQVGIGAITLPVELVAQMFAHPAVPLAVEQFTADWQRAFAGQLAFEGSNSLHKFV